MALQRMGIVKNYEDIRKFTVVVVGVGGVGSVTAEMLTRCGIGKVQCADVQDPKLKTILNWCTALSADPVRLRQSGTGQHEPSVLSTFPSRSQQGVGGVHDAVTNQPRRQNRHVQHEHHADNTIRGVLQRLEVWFQLYSWTLRISSVIKKITIFVYSHPSNRTGSINGDRVDLVLSCVDNYEARLTINTACNELGLNWFESGVSENAVCGHIQYIVPGESACFAVIYLNKMYYYKINFIHWK